MQDSINARLITDEFKRFAGMDAAAMEAQLKSEKKPTTMNVQGDDTDAILAAYRKKYQKPDGTYPEGYSAPEQSATGRRLSFPDGNSATDFAMEMAKDGKKFIACDDNGTLLGYSNGKDGIFYGADNKPLPQGADLFAQATNNIPARTFVIPEPPDTEPGLQVTPH